ncbi:uncharacterized protein LOC129247473 [Anastrepha obliqua]|uniref:uncharacterized protein LOC129247473 n=1 Tax=Anastrepha obliqua TaxID=95512 RepID=UPI0024099111|nr:uncharacterized protein LOC129247473 [Anastrepha obliqua]
MKLVVLSVLLLIGSVSARRSRRNPFEDFLLKRTRINWLPVWDSDQQPGNARAYNRNTYPGTTLPIFPIRPPFGFGVCDAPNGLGMRNLFRQAKALLPRERIRNIVRDAAGDPQIQALLKLVKTPEYRQRTANLSRSREYTGYRNFACYKMNCDLRLYADFVRNLLQFSVLEESPSKNTTGGNKGRPGIRGVLNDIQDALPRQRLRELFERLLATDWYLIRSVQIVQSYEYEAVFGMVQRNPDYQYLRRAQSQVGMPVDELKRLVYFALGWREEAQNPNLFLLNIFS